MAGRMAAVVGRDDRDRGGSSQGTPLQWIRVNKLGAA